MSDPHDPFLWPGSLYPEAPAKAVPRPPKPGLLPSQRRHSRLRLATTPTIKEAPLLPAVSPTLVDRPETILEHSKRMLGVSTRRRTTGLPPW